MAKVYYIAQSLAEAIRNNDHVQLVKLLQTKTKNSALHTLLKTFNARANLIINAMRRYPMDESKELFVKSQLIAQPHARLNWQHLRDRVFIEFSIKTKKKGNQFVAKRNDFLNSFYPHLMTESHY